MSRRNRRKNQSQNAAQPQSTGPQTARRILNELPLPTDVTYLPNVSVCSGTLPPPPPADGENESQEPCRESRANAVKGALRSKICFPSTAYDRINTLSDDIGRQLNLTSSLENWVGLELARSSYQTDECFNKLLINKARIVERATTCFDADMAERCDRTAARLHEAPSRNQRALARSKAGTHLLITKWQLFYDAIDPELGVDEALRQTAFDLLGIDHVFRHGTNRVPAATDVAGLRALARGEVERHTLNLERSLNALSESEQKMAQIGLGRFRDSTTSSLRGDLNRARKRSEWCLETLRALKNGADPSTLIDPDTKAPVAVGRPLVAVPDPPRPAAAAPAAPPPPPPPQAEASPQPEPEPASPPSPPLPPLPAGCPAEFQEMWHVAIGTFQSASAPPAGAEPGPPPRAA